MRLLLSGFVLFLLLSGKTEGQIFQQGPLGANLAYWLEDSLLKVYRQGAGEPFLSLPLNRVTAVDGERTVRSKYGAFEFKTRRGLETLTSTLIHHTLEKDTLTVFLLLDDYLAQLSLYPLDTADVGLHLITDNENLKQLKVRFNLRQDERFAGLGSQYENLILNGKRHPVWVEEQGIGRGEKPISKLLKVFSPLNVGKPHSTHYAVPWVLGNRMAVELQSDAYSVFDFTPEDEWTLETWDTKTHFRIQAGQDPKDHLIRYTARTGRMDTLPEWAYGIWMGVQGGRQRVSDIAQKAQQAGVPLSALWIQDWVGRRKTTFGSQLWWRWQADINAYPDLRGMNDSLRKRGIRVLGYVNPFLALKGPMFEHALKQGYLVRRAGDSPYILKTPGFPAAMVDLSNPPAYQWLKDLVKERLAGAGFSGWMADYAEWLPVDAYLPSLNDDAYLYHNRYADEWVRLNREAADEAGQGQRLLPFHRSGSRNAARYARLFWAGDQMVSWSKQDGLASAVTGLITAGLSGMAFTHADVGGYTSTGFFGKKHYVRTTELYKRWAELGAMMPVFRTHEGLQPDRHQQAYSNAELLAFTARMGKLRQVFLPYFMEVAQEGQLLGLPFLRPLMLHYPDNERSWRMANQFLVGSDVLVIPVTEPGANTVKAYFPEGKWVSIWAEYNRTVTGSDTEEVPAPIGKPAIFIRAGSPWYQALMDRMRAVFPGE
jgi:alpha-glucosidase